MKKNQHVSFLLLLLFFAVNVMAQGGADNASDAVYDDGWGEEDNGGTGFGNWELSATGSAGFFIGSSDINVSGDSWGTFANSGGVASAVRGFVTPMSVLDVFEVQMDNGNIQNGGTVGFALQNSAGDNLMEFFFRGGESNYEINDASGVIATGTGFTNQGLTIEIGLLTTTTFSVTITPNGGSAEMITGKTLMANANQSIAKVRLFNANAGGGSAADAFFNSISYVENALPIELAMFNAVRQNDKVKLDWATISETNNSHFIIEKSMDSRNWETLSIVNGKGDSFERMDYSAYDEKPFEGTNYYRLMQVDFDGTSTYSDIINVKFNAATNVAVYPNPATATLYVNLEKKLDGTLVLFNLQGQMVKSISIDGENSLEINLYDLPEGYYLSRIMEANGRLIDSQRILKAK